MELQSFTEKEIEERCEIGKLNVPTRFFMYGLNHEAMLDVVECTEAEFMEIEGVIEYERHTIHENGASQICLTKNPF